MALSTGEVLDRRYRIDQLLGQGGFGAVYKAWDLRLNGPCAVKENLDTSDEAQRQFAREATVLVGLLHPNLPRFIDHFYIPGFGQYLVMDFVEGIDLGELVRAQGPLPTEKALDIIGQVADALIYLHSRRPPVLHRDIKPANIKITPSGRVVLVDFGLVKAYHPHLETTVGARAVTPGYSPPEQYGLGVTDQRTDVYALAATLYTLLTGRRPPESMQRYGRDSLISPSQLNSSVPEAVSSAIGQAMSLRPTQRYQTVEQFRAALMPRSGAHTAPAAGPGPVIWIVGGAAVMLVCLLLAGAATVCGALLLPYLLQRATPRPPQRPAPGHLLYQFDLPNPHLGWSVTGGAQSPGQYDSGANGAPAYAQSCLAWPTAGAQELVLSDPTSAWLQSERIGEGSAPHRLANCGLDGRLRLYAAGLQTATADDSADVSTLR